MAEKKKSLGKGLGALFQDSPDQDTGVRDIISEIDQIGSPKADGKNVIILKTVDVEPNMAQPRKHFDEEKLEALADSIKEHGVVQPILVSPTKSGTYKIVAGERRWRASKLAEIKEIPCIIRSFDDKQTMEIALVENLQREDLNPIEEAEGYQQLIEAFNLTQDEVGQKVGKSRSAIANSLRLNNLSKDIKAMVVDGRLSQGHARALLPVEDKKLQLDMANRIISAGLNVRQTEAMVASSGKEPAEKKELNPIMKRFYKEAEKNLSSRLGTKVKIKEGSKKGKIEIEYYSKDDLERLLYELR